VSRENVETFKRSAEAWNRGDLAAWIDLFDPEVEWSALTEVFRGHEGVRQAWRSFKEHMQLRSRYIDVRDLGQSVLALGEIEGWGRATRLNMKTEMAQLVTFRSGKILSFRDFGSHAEALEAVGLEE